MKSYLEDQSHGTVPGAPQSSAIGSKSPLVLVNAPISLAMSTRISNMGNLIADAGVGGFVIVVYAVS
jgi:hypothetical protein